MPLEASVIIPTYNHARFLGEAVASVLSQTAPPLEVIVVDDGSTDDTDQVLAGFGDRIRVLRQANRGVAAARNAGATLASGEVLTWLDADDAWFPQKLERQLACLAEHPDIGLVHCGFEEIDEGGRVLAEHLDGLSGRVAMEMLLFKRPVVLGGGSGVAVPRRVFEKLGGYDEDLSTSADWDLYFRIARAFSIRFVPEILLSYRRHPGNMHGNVRAMERDMMRVYGRAFAGRDPELKGMRRRCYGNLHAVLAGSYFSAGLYRRCLRHAVQSLALTPGNARQLLGYPVRVFGRWRRGGKEVATSATRRA